MRAAKTTSRAHFLAVVNFSKKFSSVSQKLQMKYIVLVLLFSFQAVKWVWDVLREWQRPSARGEHVPCLYILSRVVPIVPDYLYSLEHSESSSLALKILPRINSTLLGPATRFYRETMLKRLGKVPKKIM